MKKGQLVIIDDDTEMRALIKDFLTNQNYAVKEFPLASVAIKEFASDANLAAEHVDLIISDIKMPEMTGIEFVQKLKATHPNTPIILITAFGSVEQAIEAIKVGAYDYITKPFKLTELLVTVERALKYRYLEKDNSLLRSQIQQNRGLNGIIGKSSAMQSVLDLVRRVSQSQANILITGESGTGKEIIAKAIHDLGPRSKASFIAINCAAIPENLLESELFGHAKGSFTGAIQKKRGLFEEAHGGTIFLDEIGDMPLTLQTKLLRVIQERKIRAVGENLDRDIDVRIIAATHRDLKSHIKQGSFREDLYYRLSVIPIHIPPLRKRKEDIPLLAEHFLRRAVATNNAKVLGFTKSALNRLLSLPWEGNVRELENVIERAVILSPTEWIDETALPQAPQASSDQILSQAQNELITLDELEKRYIKYVMEKLGNRKEKIAKTLGINRRTLYRKERDYGFVPTQPDQSFLEDSP